MSAVNFQRMSTAELVDAFTVLAVEQGRAVLGCDVPTVNRIYDELKLIEEELKIRSGDQRRALTGLYQHADPQVRVKAAKATLAVARAAAQKVLEEVVASQLPPYRLEAGMTLRNLELGIFEPV